VEKADVSVLCDAIPRRTSVRSYQAKALPGDSLSQILLSGRSSESLFASIALRFLLMRDGPSFARESGPLMRSYGRILNAPHYIVAVSETKPGYLTNAGFRMEQLILRAAAMGIGTCWMGGFYSRDKVADMLSLREDEQVVALTPIGWSASGRWNQVIRKATKLFVPHRAGRLPLEKLTFETRWGRPADHSLSIQSRWLPFLEAARHAPSWMNSQPWRFILHGDSVTLAVRRPASQKGLPYYLLDGGIAMCHMYLVAQTAGSSNRWNCSPAHLDDVRDALGIPADWVVLGTLDLPRQNHDGKRRD